MRTRTEELNLIDHILAGRTDLFEVLVEPTTPLLKPCAIRLLRSRADADEVVQEALWKAFAKLGQFRGDASFRTWLFRILVNEAKMRRRSIHREAGHPVDASAPLRDNGPGTLAQLLEVERHRSVTQALSELPPRYQCVLRLRYLEGRSIDETASALKLTRAAAKTRQHRACKMLRTQLDGATKASAQPRKTQV
jgi:RNA polymerase sigma-70 factor (ECF subfamily)